MFAVTESLPVGLSECLRSPDHEGRAFPTPLLEASTHSEWAWLPSGRTALRYALLQAGIGNDDEVLLPGYTCYAADRAVSAVATPKYVDVTDDFTLDVEHARQLVSERTAAIVPTHLYGIECDVSAVRDLADEFGLVVVEDAAQALSNLLVSETVGTVSDFTTFSFRFYKETTAYKGGLLLGNTDSGSVDTSADPTRQFRLACVWLSDAALRRLPGPVYRRLRERLLDPLARSSSSVGDATPRALDDWSRRLLSAQVAEIRTRVRTRRRNADIYDEHLPAAFERPPRGDTFTAFRYPVLVPDGERARICRRLRDHGVGCSTMYAYTVSPDGACPTADEVADRVLNLPVHSALSRSDIETVTDAVSDVWESC